MLDARCSMRLIFLLFILYATKLYIHRTAAVASCLPAATSFDRPGALFLVPLATCPNLSSRDRAASRLVRLMKHRLIREIIGIRNEKVFRLVEIDLEPRVVDLVAREGR